MQFYSGCRFFFRPLLQCVFSIQCTGLENVPKEGRVILCSNHRRITDPPILGCVLNRPIRYMAKSELFTDHGRVAAFFLNKFGAFPVKRDSADIVSMKTAVSLLEQEQLVGIFPEGRCVLPGNPFVAKAGVILLACKAKAPILPVRIEYGKKSGIRRCVEIHIGKLLTLESLRAVSNRRRNIREMTAQLNESINALGGV